MLLQGIPDRIRLALFTVLLTALPVAAQQGLLATDPFTANSGALHGIADGAGWASAWEVQNGNTSIPGYNVTTKTPLASSTGAYAIGGMSWQGTGRTLDTTAAGPFAQYLTNGLIGASGKTLYFGAMMRVDAATGDEISLTLHAGSNPAWYVSQAAVAIGYFGSASNSGGKSYWSCKVGGTVYRSSVQMVVGQAAQLTVRIDYAATNKVSLYVNPPATGLPATASATASTTTALGFRSVAYYGGSGTNQSSIDELRFAGSYGDLVGGTASLPAPENLTATAGDAQVALSWTASNGATGYQVWRSAPGVPAQTVATVTATTFVNTGLVNGTAYTYYVIATNGSTASAPSASVTATPQSGPRPTFGTNLAAVADYSRELPFVDVFKMARPWISQAQGMPWGQGPALALDANGWITSLQPGQYAETILMDNALDDQAHYPTGNYTLLYDGQGTIAFDLQSATVVSQTPGRMVVNVPPGGNGVYLMVTATQAGNPLRNIRFIMPGHESSYQSQPFYPVFLQSVQAFKALRFMEWSLTNGSTVQQWTERPTITDYTWTWRGVPLEIQIQLANALSITPWFNIPAMASDTYVQQFASLVNSMLNPGLKFYLEYSNETWNGGFSQNTYVKSRGQALGFSTDPTVAAADYTAYRSTQIFGMVRAALSTPGRIIRVIASQAANSWLSEQTLIFQNAYQQADALAIAPYFNCSDAGGYGFLGDPATASQIAAMTVDQIIDIELQHINGCALQQMQSTAAVARKYGVRMVGYEGGQSLVGYGGAENNATLTALFKAANRSPRMYSLYTTYLQNWIASGGDLFVHFTDVTAFTKYGSWGSLEYQDQDPASAPKFQAITVMAGQYK